jgi:integrase
MGLGPTSLVSLAEARIEAQECRKARYKGIDPIAQRAQGQDAVREKASQAMTFNQCSKAYIEAHEAGWRNPKHAAQWSSTLATYASPVLGNVTVDAIDTTLVLKVVETIWSTKTETAGRVRGRIEAVLDWARARGHRQGDNPARWRGHLDHLLPARAKLQPVIHHPALPYSKVGAFMFDLATQDTVASHGLQFQILTAARTGEVIGARWSEMDLDQKIWIVPGKRMKSGREHRIPLSSGALSLLKLALDYTLGEFVFPGAKLNHPLSNMAFLALLRRMKRNEITPHGFRSSFRDWAAESTSFSNEVAEMALAHSVTDKVEAAYRRGDLLETRKALMEEWSDFCRSSTKRVD